MRRPTFHNLALAAALYAAPAGAQPVAARVSAGPPIFGATAVTAASNASAATGRTLLGATAGALVGGLAGAYIGAATASGASPCQTGDPDGCLGAQLPRALWGIGIGITLGAPVGAHLGNRRRGHPAYTALASAALFAGEVVALRSLVDDGRTEHKSTVVGIAVAVPVLQIIATTIAERAFPARAR